MCVEKIPFTGTSLDDKYTNISDKEIIELHNKIVSAWERSLRKYNVKPPWDIRPKNTSDADDKQLSDSEIVAQMSARELQLVFLYKYRRKLVHKDLISAFVRKHIPNAALDQQIRHLGTQYHWNILNKGAKIPDEDEKVPSAYHYLVSIDQPNPTLLLDELTRKGRLAATDFDDLKVVYGYCCATCGRKEGTTDERNGDIQIELQQGHMEPSKALDLSNTIPQCQYCNQTYGDDFCFNEYGRVIAVYNPHVVLKSPKPIQDEMITILMEERNKRK